MQAALGGEARTQLMTLSRTYRNTRQITAIDAQIAATYNRTGSTGSVAGVDRDGGELMRLTGGNLAELTARSEAEALVPRLQQHDVDASPILNEQARYTGGVVILPVYLAKGQEFDGCLVAGVDSGNDDPETPFESRLL